ncbi:MAG: aspartate aminotransferase family protein [Anaerolineae bacterium]
MNGQEILNLDERYVLHTYARAPFVIERGEGLYVYDTSGKPYLDFVSGIAVNALGYGNPDVLNALNTQAAQLMHISNLYCSAPQAQLARQLVESSGFADKVFLCNSGTEAVEAAIKFSRKWAVQNGTANKTEILAFSNGFHGRTLGALAITPRPHYQDPYRPLLPGAKFAQFNDLESAAALLDENTCACIVEPLQGEGGVNLASDAFLVGLRDLCDQRGILLIFDEIQCGLGRTGTLWAHQPSGVHPDIMTLAKPLGGGLPIGATLVSAAVAAAMQPGDHGSTFAANPVVCAVAQVVFSKISQPDFLANVQDQGSYLEAKLKQLQAKYPQIQTVRGKGLIWGIEFSYDVAPIIDLANAKGLLTCKAGTQVLRLLPPLVINHAASDQAVAILDQCVAESKPKE